MWPLDTKQRVKDNVKQHCKEKRIGFSVYETIRGAVDADTIFSLSFEELLVLSESTGRGDFLEKDTFGFAFSEYVFAILEMELGFIREEQSKVVRIRAKKPKAKVIPFERRT